MRKSLLLLLFMTMPAVAWGQYLWCWDQDEVWAEVMGEQVVIHHDAGVYNCCWNPFEYHVMWDGGNLVVIEEEILVNGCWCLCCYDLKVTLSDLPPGPLTIFFRWEDEESGEVEEVELNVEVPSSTEPSINPADKFLVDDVWHSECLTFPAAVPDDPEQQSRTWDTIKSWYR